MFGELIFQTSQVPDDAPGVASSVASVTNQNKDKSRDRVPGVSWEHLLLLKTKAQQCGRQQEVLILTDHQF